MSLIFKGWHFFGIWMFFCIKLNMRKLQKLNEIIEEDKIFHDISLKKYNTFAVDSKCKYLITVDNEKKLYKLLTYLDSVGQKYYILGNGSNVLFLRSHINTPIIHIKGKDVRFYQRGDEYIVSAYAGVSLGAVVSKCARLGITGMEWAVGIPGSVGGAVYMNAGAFGGCMADVVQKVYCYKKFNKCILDNLECGFGYRESGFKDEVITRVILRLKKGDKVQIRGEMNKYLQARMTRKINGPSAGSVFKNGEMQAWEIIEECGLKGLRVNGAKISQEHANVIINTGNATGKDIYKLIAKIEKIVYKKKDITLIKEIKIFE